MKNRRRLVRVVIITLLALAALYYGLVALLVGGID